MKAQRRHLGSAVFFCFACSYAPVELPVSQPVALVSSLSEPRRLPSARATGTVAESQLVLASDQAPRFARQIVRQYFGAIDRESLTELEVILAKNSIIGNTREQQSEPALATWEARFRRFDFARNGRSATSLQLGVFSESQAAILQKTRSFALYPTGSQLLVVAFWESASVVRTSRPRRVEFLVARSAAGWAVEQIAEAYDELQ